jgi:hypothetical protein
VSRVPSPSEDRRKTLRVSSNNEISYPTHISFVRVTPMVGGDTTYYSRTNDARRPTDILRATFKTGSDFSARFMKVVNLPKGLFGSDFKRVRHIIAPSVGYRYQHLPTFVASRLNQFDAAIDALDKQHVVAFSIENKLQGKRGKQIVDLVRNVTSMDYTVKQKGVKSQLGPVKNLLEITPVEWMKVVSEVTIDHRRNRFTESNLDFYFVRGKKWGFDLGDRYARGHNHELVTQLAYIINPKWKFKIYERFDVANASIKQDIYSITRDLHEWEVNFIYGQTRGSGAEFLVSFSLKAFPEQPFDFLSTAFHQRKAGSQTTEP